MNPREALNRTAALSVLLLMVFAMWRLTVVPVTDLVWDRYAEIDAMQQHLSDLQRIVARGNALQQETELLRTRLADDLALWSGASAPAVAAAVQNRLRQVAMMHGGVVKTTTELRGTEAQSLQAVRIRFRIEGTIETISQTLAAIEQSRPALFVDALTIQGQDGDGSAERPPLLTLDLDVSAYRALVP
jgi:hypothetical protein